MSQFAGVLAVAEAVARAARGAPGVVGLDAGSLGEFATYGRGGRIVGVRVRLDPPEVTVRVVAEYGRQLIELAEAVRRNVVGALETDVPGLLASPVSVHVEVADLSLNGNESKQ